jgi:hypothetical protein
MPPSDEMLWSDVLREQPSCDWPGDFLGGSDSDSDSALGGSHTEIPAAMTRGDSRGCAPAHKRQGRDRAGLSQCRGVR